MTVDSRPNSRSMRFTIAAIVVGLTLTSASSLAEKKAAKTATIPNDRSFIIPAWASDRGNAKTFTERWADAEPMVAFGGESPVVIEYDIEIPLAATYTISINYAAQGARPVELWLDQTKLGQCCRTANGSWNTSRAKWEESAKTWIAPGKHTLKLERSGSFPHVVSIRFESSEPLPKGWTLARPKARKLDSPVARIHGEPTQLKVKSLRLAIEDLAHTFAEKYAKGGEFLKRLESIETRMDAATGAASEEQQKVKEELESLAREALLANPLLDFDRLLLVERGAKSPHLGLPRNWQSNSSLPKTGYEDRVAVLSPVRPEGELTTLFKPEDGRFVGDVDLDFDAGKMLFSMLGSNARWQIFELKLDDDIAKAAGQATPRELTGEQPDVDSYDACYLPNGKILFTSTACFIGVPCVYGSSHVANLYVMDSDGKNIRQLCFDQEHDWCPTVLNNGRVLYSRWEYTDTPHSNTRLLFHMNPDGTEQFAYVGSNSYWPNSFFYTRPIPNHPTKVISVIGGHHDNPRMGELVLFDPALGREEAGAAVQRIPGHGKKVEPIIRDGLTSNSWPKFLHPYPLSDKYFLVSCKPSPQSLWGLYLVDVFDNFVLIKETPGYALFEPVPLRKTTRPPIVPEKVNLASKDATVYIPDIYAGGGLKGVPRGTVKSLRIFTYHFSYQGMGGLLGVVGAEGPWDIKRVLGTVPVCADGSAKFKLPANTPVSLQPLDAEGKALQLMRSWMTAMPGEVVQCSGCHEHQNTAPPMRNSMSLNRPPESIQPWYGEVRGFSYPREVQPMIDKHCVACHDGQPQPDGPSLVDLRGTVKITDWKSVTPGNGGGHAGKFSRGYFELSRYVRRPGIESDYHMLEPMEFHADTTQLVQMLKKGHHNVKLDAEAWDRLITWIDLNCPYHGTWGEEIDRPGKQRERRRELLKLYGSVDDDPEAVPAVSSDPIVPIKPEPLPTGPSTLACANWPFDAAEAQRRQAAAGPETRRKIDLGEGAFLELSLIPAGEFVMGSATGEPDERPLWRAKIARPFWMATFEVTNQLYNRFDPAHDSRVEDKNTYQFGIHGYPMNTPEQPVVRVSWQDAMAFCRWLSEKTGQPFSLPTESQWEYACRAGSSAPFWYGGFENDFSKSANMADAKLTEFASNPYTVDRPLANPTKYDDWLPKDSRFNDGSLLTVAPGKYQPNPWGLCDMHGNAAEWTRTTYRPYPGDAAAASDSAEDHERKVVRGGSWHDVPKCSTSSFRLSYLPYQRVYNVGFRVVCDHVPPVAVTSTAAK